MRHVEQKPINATSAKVAARKTTRLGHLLWLRSKSASGHVLVLSGSEIPWTSRAASSCSSQSPQAQATVVALDGTIS